MCLNNAEVCYALLLRKKMYFKLISDNFSSDHEKALSNALDELLSDPEFASQLAQTPPGDHVSPIDFLSSLQEVTQAKSLTPAESFTLNNKADHDMVNIIAQHHSIGNLQNFMKKILLYKSFLDSEAPKMIKQLEKDTQRLAEAGVPEEFRMMQVMASPLAMALEFRFRPLLNQVSELFKGKDSSMFEMLGDDILAFSEKYYDNKKKYRNLAILPDEISHLLLHSETSSVPSNYISDETINLNEKFKKAGIPITMTSVPYVSGYLSPELNPKKRSKEDKK
jgi:hypothetical protein